MKILTSLVCLMAVVCINAQGYGGRMKKPMIGNIGIGGGFGADPVGEVYAVKQSGIINARHDPLAAEIGQNFAKNIISQASQVVDQGSLGGISRGDQFAAAAARGLAREVAHVVGKTLNTAGGVARDPFGASIGMGKNPMIGKDVIGGSIYGAHMPLKNGPLMGGKGLGMLGGKGIGIMGGKGMGIMGGKGMGIMGGKGMGIMGGKGMGIMGGKGMGIMGGKGMGMMGGKGMGIMGGKGMGIMGGKGMGMMGGKGVGMIDPPWIKNLIGKTFSGNVIRGGMNGFPQHGGAGSGPKFANGLRDGWGTDFDMDMPLGVSDWSDPLGGLPYPTDYNGEELILDPKGKRYIKKGGMKGGFGGMGKKGLNGMIGNSLYGPVMPKMPLRAKSFLPPKAQQKPFWPKNKMPKKPYMPIMPKGPIMPRKPYMPKLPIMPKRPIYPKGPIMPIMPKKPFMPKKSYKNGGFPGGPMVGGNIFGTAAMIARRHDPLAVQVGQQIADLAINKAAASVDIGSGGALSRGNILAEQAARGLVREALHVAGKKINASGGLASDPFMMKNGGF